jgi:hypothetical protein
MLPAPPRTISPGSRVQVIELLNQAWRSIDPQTQCYGPRNVKGPATSRCQTVRRDQRDVEEYVDLIAERIVQLGGIARNRGGRDATPSGGSPAGALEAPSGARCRRAAAFGRTVRVGRGENELEDAGSRYPTETPRPTASVRRGAPTGR